jgi:hypothetical protein
MAIEQGKDAWELRVREQESDLVPEPAEAVEALSASAHTKNLDRAASAVIAGNCPNLPVSSPANSALSGRDPLPVSLTRADICHPNKYSAVITLARNMPRRPAVRREGLPEEFLAHVCAVWTHTGAVSDVPDDELVPGLPGVVVERLRTELGARAEKVLGCLRTAAALVAQAEADVSGLRLAESAAYNLREALNHVVEGQDAAEGGLRAVVGAWRRFKAQTAVPGVEAAAARDELDQVLSRVAADQSRASYYARRLVAYLQYRAGVRPLDAPGDPVSEYRELRDKASAAVHDELTLAGVEALLARTVAWFVRVFTPPDQVAEAIRVLAAQPWSGPEQIAELKRLSTDDHHLRLFFSEVTDPAWLEPLYQAGVVHLPSRQAAWPVAALLAGLGKTSPEAVVALLRRLLAETAAIAKDERAAARFELLRIATQIGHPAHGVAVEIVRQHSDVPSVLSLGVNAALRADAADSAVLGVADAVLNHFRRFGDGDRYQAVTILDQLQAGVTVGNVADRAEMLAGKTRRLAQSDEARFVVLGIEALIAHPGEHPEPLVLFAHHLARILSKARQWCVPTSEQLEWLGEMQGEVGERLRGHALAGASDVPVTGKIAHIAGRLSSSTATAEDLALVTDILSYAPAQGDLAAWAEALGTPSPAPTDGTGQIPRDWARAWRWAAVLPASVLAVWRDAIDYVSGFHGAPDPQALTGDRPPRWVFSYGRSPYNAEELSARPPLETAALVAAWEPNAESEQMFGHLELARTLEEVVKANPAEWSTAPQDVVAALGQQLYIEHYFRALTEQAADIVPQASAVLAAALAQPPAGGTQEAGQDTEEPAYREDWQKVVLDLAKALANKDGDLAASLNDLWERALEAVRSVPGTDIGLLFADHDPLTSAINRTWGHGLQTVLALAAWEFRSRGIVRSEFEQTLNAVIGTVGSVGLEFRVILASRRPLLEAIAANWLEAHAAALFREGTLAQETFDLTVKWSQPTTWLYREFTDELFGAALRGADNAIRFIVVAALHEVEGYDLDTVINRLGKDPAVLATAAEDATFLVQDAEPDSPHLMIAIRFWTLLLDTGRAKIPAQALTGLGRWAFVGNIDDNQWAYLTARTLDLTDSRIDYPISVADRAARVRPSSTSRSILLRLLDNGEPWERHHAAVKALDMLRASITQPADDSFRRLRTRLIDLGHHEAATINPPDTTE